MVDTPTPPPIPRESLAVWGFSFLFLAILQHELVAFLYKNKSLAFKQ
jgi:hypothetical protein